MTDIAMPTRLADRIETLDVLRGVAICGILLMNIPSMGMVGTLHRPPLPATWNADWITWLGQRILFAGSMRGLFTLLFGAGMVLMLRRAEGMHPDITPIDVWTRRCLALLALGVVNFLVLLWPGEILWCYGLTGFILLAFRTMRPRTLLLAAAICLVGLTASDGIDAYRQGRQYETSVAARVALAAHRPLTDAQKEAIAAADKQRAALYLTPQAIAEERAQRTYWPTLVAWSWATWSDINGSYFGWFDLAESLCFMLIGMALFRTGILTGQASRATYLHMTIWGYVGGCGLRVLNMWLTGRIGYDFVPAGDPLPVLVFRFANFEVARLLVTIGHVGFVILLFRSGMLGRATPLRALGRMALTTYLAQSLITSILFYGLGLVGTIGFAGLMAISAAIWIATGAFCLWWLGRHEMGPAEALLRAMAYGSFGPRRRREAAAALAATPAI